MATPRATQSVTTTELYDRWAQVYDTDGNILQSIDDLLIPDLLSQAFNLASHQQDLNITEIGCGTGRNTLKLLTPRFSARISSVTALDLSRAMLSIAQERCSSFITASASGPSTSPRLTFHEYDALQPTTYITVQGADIVLSTLVLEHLPLAVFFSTARTFLQRDGLLVISNMHAEMGRRSQAGFVDQETGAKVRGQSFVYEVPGVLEEARRQGFVVEGEVLERAVREEDLERGVVGERGAKWVGCRVWFGIVMRFKGFPEV